MRPVEPSLACDLGVGDLAFRKLVVSVPDSFSDPNCVSAALTQVRIVDDASVERECTNVLAHLRH
eukprot:m.334907 g.334907  ORF g.334907 m.334907 type:complete len:65 (+) comp16529_c0_seq33:2057-2251(+)